MNKERFQQLNGNRTSMATTSTMNAGLTLSEPGYVISSEEARVAAAANAASLQDEVRRQLIVLQQQQQDQKKKSSPHGCFTASTCIAAEKDSAQAERKSRLQKFMIRRESSLNQELLQRVFPKCPAKSFECIQITGPQRRSMDVMGDTRNDCLDIHLMSLPAPQPSQDPLLQIEISAGTFAPLRGAGETLAAVEDGNVVPCGCVCCSSQFICIANVEYVLCPECRVVNPLQPQGASQICMTGVGLGMNLEEYNAIVEQRISSLGISKW